MTTLALLNGKRYTIKEDANYVANEIAASTEWIKLTMLTEQGLPGSLQTEAKITYFMKEAIAYWH